MSKQILTTLKTTRIFSAYASRIANDAFSGFSKLQYYCEHCDQQFAAAWGRANPINPWISRGSRFICPYCGTPHEKEVGYVSQDSFIPHKAVFTVKSFKTKVYFIAKLEVFKFYDLFKTDACCVKEEFCFDIANHTTTFTQKYSSSDEDLNKEESLLIGSMFDVSIYSKSLLKYITSNSSFVVQKRKEITDLMKVLREEIASKMKIRDNNAPSSLYFNALGSEFGVFLPALLNLAHRNLLPDAHNLPNEYAYNLVEKYLDDSLVSYISEDWLVKAISESKKGSSLSAIIKAAGLPDIASVKNAVAEKPLRLGFMRKAFIYTKDPNLALRLFHQFVSLSVTGKKYLLKPEHSFNKFLSFLKKVYGETKLVAFIENRDRYHLDETLRSFDKASSDCLSWIEKAIPAMSKLNSYLIGRELIEKNEPFLNVVKTVYGEKEMEVFSYSAVKYDVLDCARMYQSLSAENQQKFIDLHLPFKRIHDWLAETYREQDHKGYAINVPEHVKKRLAMQMDRLKFFLPTKSIELLAAGDALSNCVANYGVSMSKGNCFITLITDDNGKLVAAIEVRDNKIVQAEVERNKPVSIRPDINQAVIDWARRAGLEIATSNICLEANSEKSSIAV